MRFNWLHTKSVILFFIGLVIYALPSTAATDTTVLVKVNHFDITNAELNREMTLYRAAVWGEFNKNSTIVPNDFWNRSLNGTTPLEILKKRALDTLIKIKIQEQLLIDHHLWSYKNYSELKEDMRAVNAKRKSAKERNEIIYGPLEFTEQTFFDYQFSNAVNKLKKEMYKSEIIDDDTLYLYYKNLGKTIYKNKNTNFITIKNRIREYYLEEKYNTYILNLVKYATIQ